MILVLSAVLALGFASWRLARRIRFFLHIHQLEGYANRPYLAWVLARPLDVVIRRSHLIGAGLLAAYFLAGLPSAALHILWAMAFASSARYRRDRPKKPLVFTQRLRRQTLLVGVATLPVILLFVAFSTAHGWALLLAGVGLADLLAPFLVWVGALLAAPGERYVHGAFKAQARAKLAARPDLKIVAITGSYGKTSVKFAVAEVLAQRYQVLATPGSYNTPMGICKVINNDLQDHHQVLVLEMGIRHPGDIAELCAIARPDIAVITGVGIAHLETMGSSEAIANEKGSLLNYLRDGGTAVLNRDDAFYGTMAEKAPHTSVSATGQDADLRADSIRFGAEGTQFDVTDRVGRQTPVAMTLLGRHHVGNALLALGVGSAMGIRLRAGARALARLKPVPHRLTLREEEGLLVLDDAFNSNPVGARNAVEVLAAFAPRTRFVVTPGMVELGARELEENQALGAFMVGRVDEVILVGPARTAAISAGLRENGMQRENIHVVASLFEARDLVRARARPGDVVLYENDLPDQYTEA